MYLIDIYHVLFILLLHVFFHCIFQPIFKRSNLLTLRTIRTQAARRGQIWITMGMDGVLVNTTEDIQMPHNLAAAVIIRMSMKFSTTALLLLEMLQNHSFRFDHFLFLVLVLVEFSLEFMKIRKACYN